MNIILKILYIIAAGFFTLIIISILSDMEYFMIYDTINYRILTIITLISLWIPIFIKNNMIVKLACFFLFLIYILLYIAHPLL